MLRKVLLWLIIALFLASLGFFVADDFDSRVAWILFVAASTIDLAWRIVDEYRDRRASSS